MKIDDTFLLDTANRAFLDGKKRLPVGVARPGTWVIGVVALVVTLSGLGLIAGGYWEELKIERLKTQGARTTATVVKLTESSAPMDSRDPDTYSVTYRYSVNGVSYEGEGGLSWSEYTSLSEGASLEIRYDPRDPPVSKLERVFEDQEREGMSAVFGVLVVMTLAGVFWLVVWYIRGLRPLWRMMKEGRTVRGEVVDCRGRSEDDDYRVTLAYRFIDPDGNEVTNRAETVRDDLKASVLPTPGTPVVVYFVDSGTYAVL